MSQQLIRSQEHDVFNLSPDELKKLVQGVVWRDEHFDGMALKEIAKREGCSEDYVGKVIFRSFDTLQKGFPVNSLLAGNFCILAHGKMGPSLRVSEMEIAEEPAKSGLCAIFSLMCWKVQTAWLW